MVDDVPNKAEKTSEPKEGVKDVDTGALVEDEELTIEQQLAIVEDGIMAEDAAQGGEADTETADSEESDETVEGSTADEAVPAEFRGAIKEEVSLQMRIAQLEAENAALKNAPVNAAAEDEDDDDFDYDIGDIDESFEALREPLNAMGKFHIAENQKILKAVAKLNERFDMREREDIARSVKRDLDVSDDEERNILKWTQNSGVPFHDEKTLRNAVRLYRDAQELAALRAGNTTKQKAKGNPRVTTSKSKSSSANDTVETSGGSFEDSFAKAVRVTNQKISRGELR